MFTKEVETDVFCMEGHLELISPDQATDYLKLNINNRPLSPQTVRKYSDAMKAGKWMPFTGEPIKFDTNGLLRDGQHRLAAVVAYALPIHLFVVRGIDPEAFIVLDGGKKRTAGDGLSIVGFKNYNMVAALAKSILLYENTKRSTVVGGTLNSNAAEIASNQAVLAYATEHDLQPYVQHAHVYYKSWPMISTSTWAFFDWLLSHKDEKTATTFLAMLSTGIGLDHEKHPCAYVRKRLNNALALGATKPNNSFMYELVVTAWNLFRKKRLMSKFDYLPSQERSEPV